MLKNVKIGVKIVLGFLVIVVVMLFVSWISLNTFNKSNIAFDNYTSLSDDVKTINYAQTK